MLKVEMNPDVFTVAVTFHLQVITKGWSEGSWPHIA